MYQKCHFPLNVFWFVTTFSSYLYDLVRCYSTSICMNHVYKILFTTHLQLANLCHSWTYTYISPCICIVHCSVTDCYMLFVNVFHYQKLLLRSVNNFFPESYSSAAIERPNQTSLFGFGHWWRQWYKKRPGYNTPFYFRSSLFLVDSV